MIVTIDISFSNCTAKVGDLFDICNFLGEKNEKKSVSVWMCGGKTEVRTATDKPMSGAI